MGERVTEKVGDKPGDSGKKTTAALSPTKKRVFWALTFALPLAFLLVLELVLRALGFGYPVHFFVPAEGQEPGRYAENPKFGWQFFPRRLARAPDPIRINKEKAPGTYRIFVFGESAALGDPEPAYGFSRILREVLEERCPGTKFEVVNVGMTAISSHVVLRIARDCAAFGGDVWLVYMGNNEVVGPFGAGSVFGMKAPPRVLVGLSTTAKRTCLGQVFDQVLEGFTSRKEQPEDWQGMKMFLNEQIRSDDPALQRVYNSFRANLNEIISVGWQSGAKIIVSSVSLNLRDCPPFGSLHRENLPATQQAEWTNLVQKGIECQSGGQLAEALAMYRQAAAIDGSDAVLSFRTAQCCGALGESAAAREAYLRARDLDTLRFRADTAINEIIRSACTKGLAGVSYFDADQVIRNATPAGIPGGEFFWDHVHFNFDGNYRIACGLADEVLKTLDLDSKAKGKLLSEVECAEGLALTDWDQRQIVEQMWRRMQEPPFTAQLGHEKLIARFSELRSELERKTDAAGLRRSADIHKRAAARRADDWVLHHRLALVLEAAGELANAEEQWKEVIKLVPGYPDALFKLGETCFSQSRLTEAAEYYECVLRVRADSFEAMNGLGLVRMSQGRPKEAANLFERALRMNRRFAQAHVNLGLLAAQSGSSTNAEFQYREALRGDPECVAAHINFGNLLASEQRHSDAISHYVEALKLRPGAATVHFSLANSLEAVGRHSDALAEYREAVRLNPKLPEAQFNLGLALAKSGDLAGATTCFKAAVQLTPADPQAHLNLGVALARQRQVAEAIPEFEAVLRLDPSNETARQYLKTAAAMREAQPQENKR